MKTRIGIILAGAILAGGLAGPVQAGDHGTVDVDVTAATPCLIVSPTEVHFGTLPFTPDQYSVAGIGSQTVGYESCAGIDETVYGRGTDATGTTATWSLTRDAVPCLNPDLNIYKLDLQGSAPGVGGFLSTQDQSLETVHAGEPGSINQLRLQMPCVGADGAGETMTLQVIFTATF